LHQQVHIGLVLPTVANENEAHGARLAVASATLGLSSHQNNPISSVHAALFGLGLELG
jgi:hypothetical protein